MNSPVNTLLILAAFLFMLAASCQRDTVTADETFKDSSSVSVSTREETSESSQNSSSNVMSTEFDPIDPVVPFTDMSAKILGDGSGLWNFLPGVVIFDYDRDGDMDIFLTQMGGYPNLLYRNDGYLNFVDVAAEAGIELIDRYSTGAIACDLDNDGYQDLYVGAAGNPEDDLDYRSPSHGQGNKDALFHNNGDGTFTDITDLAFEDGVNLRSATTVACADVDNDGWLEIYVGNLQAEEFRTFNSASHPGHYNVLYRNNGDLTFTDVADSAGVRGTEILMRDHSGAPIVFIDPDTGNRYEGWDPTVRDRMGNGVGDPTGQTHAVMFYDYDDDRDPDLFVADDGDKLKIYRNDSADGVIEFTQVADEMGLDVVGAWMGFTTGDYDGDGDLDVFVTNIGYHPLLRRPQERPNGSCEYHHQFSWGTCLNYLLRNDGRREVQGLGIVGDYKEVAWDTPVRPSRALPPDSLDGSRIYRTFLQPTGIAAYDFGFGATFFDLENDGDQDLYWLGSTKGRGEGPGGDVYPGAGRLLRGDGTGSFEDVTVEAHMLDIVDVDYSVIDRSLADFDGVGQRISGRFHENGKGVAHGDLNGDGYLDIIGTNSSGVVWQGRSENLAQAKGPVFVWINGNDTNHWIIIRLKGRMAIDGTGSNGDGIGARVYLRAASDSDEKPVLQVQEVRAGSSYLSMDSIDLEFGIGLARLVDEITILWPSGKEQKLEDVEINQVLEIVEPTG